MHPAEVAQLDLGLLALVHLPVRDVPAVWAEDRLARERIDRQLLFAINNDERTSADRGGIGETRAIGTENHTLDTINVAFEGVDNFAGNGLPHLHIFILSAGQVLKVMATDPGSVKDFQAFCKQTGNELLSHSEGAEFTFFMKKR